MTKGNRVFRTAASLAEEGRTRDAIAPFLSARGYTVLHDQRQQTGTAIAQFLRVQALDGRALQMRVRLCWRRTDEHLVSRKISAAQLRAKLVRDDWDETLEFVVARDREEGNTHHLFVQRDDDAIVYAALIPLEALPDIWRRQRDVSAELLAQGVLGRMRANHAMNGTSPTIWLQDERQPASHAVPDVLWQWPDVVDLATLPLLPLVTAVPAAAVDDTFDDCLLSEGWQLGSDGGERRAVQRSEVRRDPKVRRAVIVRASGCERDGCTELSRYPGFLDVHHILGVEKSDRVWNCVALCPNCHRDAHYSADAAILNLQLLAYAERFQPNPRPVLGDETGAPLSVSQQA